jgi:signal peptidase II
MKKGLILYIPILVLIDQVIKMIVAYMFMEYQIHFTSSTSIPLIEGVLTFSPHQNTNLGWIPSMLGLTMPVYMAVLISVFSLLIVIIAYRLMVYTLNLFDLYIKYKVLAGVFLIFCVAAAICKLIDDIFWGGSIDYIGLFDWFTFDLKDVYINIAVAFILIWQIIYLKNYYKLAKDERKEYDEKLKFFRWIKKRMPLEEKTAID